MVSREKSLKVYREVMKDGTAADLAYLCKNDLYFLLCFMLNRRDADHPFLYDRIREFEAQPDGMLDLWARGHYKSTIITFAGSIQEILRDPNITIGVFSHTRPIATNFTRQIKIELESNKALQALFPFIKPPAGTEVRPWGESMLCVQRTKNKKEQTLEAWGIVQGQPTSKHFDLRVYDDLVVPESVTTPEMIQKTTDQFVLSENLGTRGGRRRAIGTRYHYDDSYAELMKRGVFKPRLYAATDDGTEDGAPVFLSPEELEDKRKTMGSYIFGCQMLQDPVPGGGAIIQSSWVKYWNEQNKPSKFDRTLISMDCAFKDKKESDYVVMQAWGQLGSQAYLLDQWRGKVDFVETCMQFIRFCSRWPMAHTKLIEDKANGPAVLATLKGKVNGLIPVEPYGSKEARVYAVSPFFEAGNIFIPEHHVRDWAAGFEYELTKFPYVTNDDQVDACSQALNRMFRTAPMMISEDVLEGIYRERSKTPDYNEERLVI